MRPKSNRILIVDDSEAIHHDIIKILSSPKPSKQKEELEEIERELFYGDVRFRPPTNLDPVTYRIDSAFQGKEAIDLVARAEQEQDPYALVFMDVRMPPGIDGIETIENIWRNYPSIEMVIVTAYSDHTWEEILKRIGTTDRLMVLRKPFDLITIKQLALALTKKYNMSVKVHNFIEHMELEIRNGNDARVGRLVHELKGMLD